MAWVSLPLPRDPRYRKASMGFHRKSWLLLRWTSLNYIAHFSESEN